MVVEVNGGASLPLTKRVVGAAVGSVVVDVVDWLVVDLGGAVVDVVALTTVVLVVVAMVMVGLVVVGVDVVVGAVAAECSRGSSTEVLIRPAPWMCAPSIRLDSGEEGCSSEP